MIALAWPFVGLCFVALLWRALDLALASIRARTENHALSIRDHSKLLELDHKQIIEIVERLQRIEDHSKILEAKIPTPSMYRAGLGR